MRLGLAPPVAALSVLLAACPPEHQEASPGPWPAECYSCHQWDYEHATSPAHVGHMPTDCDACHDMSGWIPVHGFAHDLFPLTGAHAQAPCAGCHGDPPHYLGTPTACVGCHQADYDASPYPGHGGFPLTCQDCHSTTAWKPATGGSHPERAFPISRGPHAGIECADCHDAALSSSYAENVNCLPCHGRARMDDVHLGEVGGYRWDDGDPDFCRRCHPTGIGGDDD